MIRFLRDLEIDRLSFWLGILAATLFWWLVLRLRPTLKHLFQTARERFTVAREGLTSSADVRLRNDLIRYAEGLHLAAPLFSLDEIIIQPSILSPPIPVDPDTPFPSQDISERSVPYMPDWPEMAALYGSPRMSLAEALQNGGNLILMGRPGSGKTVALAQLAILIARRETLPGGLEQLLPIFIHIADLQRVSAEKSTPIDYVLNALSHYTSGITQNRLEKHLPSILSSGKAILLIDGIDELPPMQVAEAVENIKNIYETYPSIRVAIATSCQHYDGLLNLGLQPVAISVWSKEQRAMFIMRWSHLWLKYVGPESGVLQEADPELLNAWLLNENIPWSPLEITLKIWALYSGDLLGPSGANAIEAYLRRSYFDSEKEEEIPEARTSLERLAAQMVLTNNPIIDRKLIGAKPEDIIIESQDQGEQIAQEVPDSSAHFEILQEKAPKLRSIDAMVEQGLLCEHTGSRIRFIHPVITGYLAGYSLDPSLPITDIVSKTGSDGQAWDILTLTLEFAAIRDGNQLVESYLAFSTSPLYTALLNTGRWLRNARDDAPWRAHVLRALSSLLQNEQISISLRARIVSAMVTSNSQGINLVLSQMASSTHPVQRQLSALGAGLLGDEKAIDNLIMLLDDQVPSIRSSSCLALTAIGTRSALEALAEALLHSDENLRQYAAEAFANHPEEGYPTLQEGSTIDDLLVRRAVVSGLKRVGEPWAIETLEKMRVEDPQWVVKNMAVNALEELAQPDRHIPQSISPLHDTPWLISYAGESGEGIAPGTIATDHLYRALSEGNEEQILAAIHIVLLRGDSRAIPDLYSYLYGENMELREAAFNAFWHLTATGIRIPPPAEFAVEYS